MRLAYRRGVRVVAGGVEDLPAFYQLLGSTAERQGFFIREMGYIRDLMEAFLESGRVRLFLAFRQGKLLAGALVVVAGQKASYLLGASGSEGRQHMPVYLVQWEAIRWAHAQGAKIYDFLGIGHPKRPGKLAGLWTFKRKFGAVPVSFVGEWDLALMPFPYLLWSLFEGPASRARAIAARLETRRRSAPLEEAPV